MGLLGIFGDVVNILDVPVSILAIKFDPKIFQNFRKKSLEIFVTVANCNGSEVYGSEVLV